MNKKNRREKAVETSFSWSKIQEKEEEDGKQTWEADKKETEDQRTNPNVF